MLITSTGIYAKKNKLIMILQVLEAPMNLRVKLFFIPKYESVIMTVSNIIREGFT